MTEPENEKRSEVRKRRRNLYSLVRVISDWIVLVDQGVDSARFSEEVDRIFHVIVAINDPHVSFSHKLEENI